MQTYRLSIIASAVALTLCTTNALATDIANVEWNAQTENPSLTNDELVFADPTADKSSVNDDYRYVSLFVNGVSGSITADSVTFKAHWAATNNSSDTHQGYNAVGITNGGSLNIDTGTLYVGARDNEKETGGDRGFRLSGAGNSLQIFADTILSYTGDEFVHVRGGKDSIANIGSETRRVQYFEAHTGWGKDDYGVAILQANEGGTINLYAVDALFDGPTGKTEGGVIGSGGYGTVNVDVSGTLTIDGNLCGNYGRRNDPGEEMRLNVKAQTLKMTGDVNVGSGGTDNSNLSRNSVVTIIADNLTIDGDINVDDHKKNDVQHNIGNKNTVNLIVNNTGNITGTVFVSQDNGTSQINLGGSGDMTESAGKFKAENGGTLAFQDNGTWSINTWEGTNGNLKTSNEVTVESNTTVTADKVTLSDTSVIQMNDGSKLAATALSGTGTILVNTADEDILSASDVSTDTLSVSLSADQNDKYATVAEARAALGRSIGETNTAFDGVALSGQEGAVSDSWTVSTNDQGEVINTKANEKLAGFNAVNSLSIFSWRHELNNLGKRMGDLRDMEGNYGAWARVFGSQQKYSATGQLNKNTTIQVGADTTIGSGWTLGGAFSYTDGSVSADNATGDNKAYGFTLYGIWQHEKGSYFDVTARYSRLDADFTSGLNGNLMSGSYDNNAYSVSMEAGHKFELTELGFVEPQLEVIYGHIEGDDFTASNGTRVEQKNYDSLIGRLGARAGFYFPEKKGNIYARFSVVHDFDGEIETTATNGTSRSIKEDLGGTWVEYGIGGNFRLSDNSNVYVDLERTSGGDVTEQWRWNVGMRYAF